MYLPTNSSNASKNAIPLSGRAKNLNFDQEAYSHRLAQVTGEAVQELSRGRDRKGRKRKYSFRDYQQALLDPQLRACIELKKLRSGSILGLYNHKIPALQQWIRNILADMSGTIEDLVARSAIAPYYGLFTAEIVFRNRRCGFRNEWILKEFIYHNVVSTGLAGNKYGVTHVIDKSSSPHVWIPVDKCIYVANDLDNSRNPFGTPSAEAAMPYIKSRQALISQWLIAGKNHSMGLLLGKASSQNTTPLIDNTGKPVLENGNQVRVSAVKHLERQLQQLEDKNFLSTELENEVNWLNLPVDSNFFNSALAYLDKKILLTQNIPSMTFEESSAGLGSATPALQQMLLMDAQIQAAVRSVKDQILEKVVKKMLRLNKKVTPEMGYGDFTINPNTDPQTASLKTQNLLYAISSGAINSNDTGANNALREMLDLPKLDEQEYLDSLIQSTKIQALQQQLLSESQAQQEPLPDNQTPPES
jgi:hypothetical protein